MILNYQTFYRKFGVRQVPHLLNPILSDTMFLDPPMESVYDFLSYDASMVGPSEDDAFFKNIKRPIPVATELHLKSLEGSPRLLGGSVTSTVTNYYRKNRRLRQLKDLTAYSRDKQTVLVYNYAMLSRLYRYPQSVMSHYYQWKNIFSTMLKTVAEVTQSINHQHFIFTKIPHVLPSIQQLTTAADGMPQASLKVFNNPEILLLLELWKWFTGEPKSSLFSLIPNNKIHLVNLVLEESGKWMVINLGILHSFFDDPEVKRREKEKKEGGKPGGLFHPGDKVEKTEDAGIDVEEYVIKQSKNHLDGKQIAKRLLRLYMTMMELRTVTASEEETTEPDQKDPDIVTDEHDGVITADTANDEDDDDDETDVSKNSVNEPYVGEKEKLVDIISATQALPDLEIDIEDLTVDEFRDLVREEDLAIDADLKRLEEIAEAHAAQQGKEHTLLQDILTSKEDPPIENAIKQKCLKLAKDGLLSAAEMRKFEKLASAYKTFKSPFSDEPFPEFLKVSQDLLKVGATKLPDSPGVIDKTMGESTLSEFDSKYVKKVLHRDISNAVMSFQKVGVAVTSYKVNRELDVLGGYEEHVVKLAPVEGASSVWRFKVPIIREDGSFVSNGVRYVLRKQRGDK